MVILTKNMGISRFLEVTQVNIPQNYEIQMLINNEMRYIPDSSMREINGEKSLRVKIDGMATLSDTYGRSMPTMDDVKVLLADLKNCLNELRTYLLNPDHLVLNTRYILYDSVKGLYQFLYVPGDGSSFKEQLKGLFEEIMRVYDHQDQNGVMYLYDLYSRVLGDNFTPELFSKMIGTFDRSDTRPETKLERRAERKTDSKPERELERPQYEELGESKVIDVYPSEERDRGGRTLHIAVSAVAVILAVLLYILFGVRSFKVSALLAVILVAYFVIDYLKNKEEQEEAMAMKAYIKPEPRIDSGLEPRAEIVSDSPHNELKKPLISEEYIETSVLPSGRNETSVSCLVPLDKSKSKEIYLIEGETRVGRQRNMCDFYLNDSSVSRVHAIFEKKGDKVTVRDAGSTNGTYLNDKRLSMEEEAETNLGDTISIADIQYECF